MLNTHQQKETELRSGINKDLHGAWQALIKKEPGLRIRNAAQRLGVSEMDLLLTQQTVGQETGALEHHTVTTLFPESAFALVKRLPALGKVMALTRNESSVHEKIGIFSNPKGSEKMALTLGDQDQRFFLSKWRYFFSVFENHRKSIQVFDEYGTAIWKVFAIDESDHDAWKDMEQSMRVASEKVESEKNAFRTPLQTSPIVRSPWMMPLVDSQKKNDLLQGWQELTDVHQFHGLLTKLKLDRRAAYEIAQHNWTHKLDIRNEKHCAEQLLGLARDNRVPLMVFTGNSGLVQIFTGSVSKLRRTGPWFNVLDHNFNLHLNTTQIDSAWVVSRPTGDGLIHSVELFDQFGNTITTFFGERHEGEAEREDWRALVEQLKEQLKLPVMEAC